MASSLTMLFISYFFCSTVVVLRAPTVRGFLVPYTLGDTTIMIDASEMPAMPSPLRQHIMGGLAKRLHKPPVFIKSSQVHNILPLPNSEKQQFLFGSEEDIPVYHINREILQYRSDLQYPTSGSVEFNSGEPEGQPTPIEYGFDLSSAGKYVENKADAAGVSYDFVGDGQGNVQVNVLNSNEYQNRIDSDPVNGNGLLESDSLRRKTRKPIQTADDKHSYNELRIRTTDPPPSLVSLTVTPNLFGEINRDYVNREYSGVSVKHLLQDQLNSGHGNDETMNDVYVNMDPVFQPSVASKIDSSQIPEDITYESSSFTENDGYPKNTNTGSNLIGNFQEEHVVEPEFDGDNISPDFFDGTAIRNRESVNYFPTRPSSQNNHLNSGLRSVKRDATTGPNNYNVYDYTTVEDFQRVPPLNNDVNEFNYFKPEILLANQTLKNKQSTRNPMNNAYSEESIVENPNKEKSHFVSIDNFIQNKKESFYKPTVQKGDKHEVHLPISFIEKIYNRKEYDSDSSENNFTNEDHSNDNLANFNSPTQMQKRLANFNNAVFSAKVGDLVLSEEKREKSAQNGAVFEQSEAGKNPRFSLTRSHGIAIDSLEELRLINDVRQIVASLKQDEESSPSFQSAHVLLANAMSYPDDANHFTYKQEEDQNTMGFPEPGMQIDNRIQTKLMQLLLHSAAGQASKDRLAAGGHYLSDGQLHNLQALVTGQSLLSGQSPTGAIPTVTVSPSVQNKPDTSLLRPLVPKPPAQVSGTTFGGLSFVEQFVEDQLNQGDHLKELSTVLQQLIPESTETDQPETDQSGLQELLTEQPGSLNPLPSQSESQTAIASETGSAKPTRTEAEVSKPIEIQSVTQKPIAVQSVTQKPLASNSGQQKPTAEQSVSQRPQKPLASNSGPQRPTAEQSVTQKPITSESQKPMMNQPGSQQPATGQTSSEQPTGEQSEVQETSSIPPLSGTFLEATSIVEQASQDVTDPPMKDVLVEYGGSLHAASAALMDKGTCRCGLRFAQKVVGGKAVSISEFPWLAGLARTDTDFVFCGASFVSDRHLVTAAHCVYGFTPSAIYVRAGEARREGPATTLAVKAIRLHDRYDPYEKDYDIAVVTLESPVEFSPSVLPICMPSHASPAQIFRSGVVAGWGRTREGANVSSTLQAATVDLLTEKQCKQQSSYKKFELNDRVICARAPGKDACQGDSGGPLMVAHGNHIELIGLVSWGIGCADERYPGIYTKVSLYRTWIKASTRTGSKCSNVPIDDVQTSRASVASLDQRLSHNIPRVPSLFGALTAYLFPVLKASFDNQQMKLLQDKIVSGSISETVFEGNLESVPTKGTDNLLNFASDVGNKLRSELSPDGELSTDRSSLESETPVLTTERSPLESETTILSTESSTLESQTTILSTESFQSESETTIISTESSPLESQTTIISTESSPLQSETTVDTIENNDAKPADNLDADSNKKSDAIEVPKGDTLPDKTISDDSDVITMHDITLADPKFNFTLSFDDVNKEKVVQKQNQTNPFPGSVTEMYPGGSLETISDYTDTSKVPVQKNITKLDINSIEAIVQSISGESSDHSPLRGSFIQVTSPQNGISDSNAAGFVRPLVTQTTTMEKETSKPVIGNEVRENGTIVLQLDNIVIADPSFNFTLDFDNSSKSVGSTPAPTGALPATEASNQQRANGTIVVELQDITISKPNFNFTLDFDDIESTVHAGGGQAIIPNKGSRKNASSDGLITIEDITISQPNFNFTLDFEDIVSSAQVGGGQAIIPNETARKNASSDGLITLEDITIANPGFNFTLTNEDVSKIENQTLLTNGKIPTPQNGTLIFAASDLTFSEPNFRFSLDFDDVTGVKADRSAGSELKSRDIIRSSVGNLKKMQHSVPEIDTVEPIIREKGEKISGGFLQNFSGMIIDSIHKLDNYMHSGNIIGNDQSRKDSTLQETAVKEGGLVGNHNKNDSSSTEQHPSEQIESTSTQITTTTNKVSNSTVVPSADQLNEAVTEDHTTNSTKDGGENWKRDDIKDISAQIAEVQSQGVETPFYNRLQDTLFGGWTGGGDAKVRINDKVRTERKPQDDLNDAINKIIKHMNS